MTSGSRYTHDRQLEVAIFAERTNDAEAAAHFAIPRRSVSRIRSRWAASPELAQMRGVVRVRLADQYADLEQLALARTGADLANPATAARDVARYLDVLSRERALTAGQATSRSESVTVTLEAIQAASPETLDATIAVLGRYKDLTTAELIAEQQVQLAIAAGDDESEP